MKSTQIVVSIVAAFACTGALAQSAFPDTLLRDGLSELVSINTTLKFALEQLAKDRNNSLPQDVCYYDGKAYSIGSVRTQGVGPNAQYACIGGMLESNKEAPHWEAARTVR